METDYQARPWTSISEENHPDQSSLDDSFESYSMEWIMNDPSQTRSWDFRSAPVFPARKPPRKTFSDEAHQAINLWLKMNLQHPYMTKGQEDWFIARYSMTRSELRTALNNRRQRFIKLMRAGQMAGPGNQGAPLTGP
jgi:hypothetical protein